ncbi:hypothetical protein V8C86DRAFT_670645 [Haematococcus lacustris]
MAPPPGLPQLPTRVFHSGVAVQGVKLQLGDFAELVPQLGEPAPRIVRLDALWAELPADGLPRHLARATRMYRPEETVFNLPTVPGQPRLLFCSEHLEERVPLQCVVRKVEVAVQRPAVASGVPREGKAAATSTAPRRPTSDATEAGAEFVVQFTYDHLQLGLKPLQ